MSPRILYPLTTEVFDRSMTIWLLCEKRGAPDKCRGPAPQREPMGLYFSAPTPLTCHVLFSQGASVSDVSLSSEQTPCVYYMEHFYTRDRLPRNPFRGMRRHQLFNGLVACRTLEESTANMQNWSISRRIFVKYSRYSPQIRRKMASIYQFLATIPKVRQTANHEIRL